jgi:N-acetylmuramic acid 6-phosphate etherase
MDSPGTDRTGTLDTLSPQAALDLLLSGQMDALSAVSEARPALACGAARMAESLRSGGHIAYAGAGSSGLMAMADALELPGTFGIPVERIILCMAGGMPSDAHMPGDTEDDPDAARAAGAALCAKDTAIVVSASGTTPFALAFATAARASGASVIALANVPGAALFAQADIAVCLPTPPEVLAGSTRMGAGTAQKAALNMMSTLAGVLLGHVHAGQMVNLRADNAKLRARALGMVARIAHVAHDPARAALEQSGWDVKLAILLAAGAPDPDTARKLLDQAQGRLEPALTHLQQEKDKQEPIGRLT